MRKGYVALGVMLTALSLGACQKKTDQKNTTASTQAQDTSKQEVEAKKFEYPHIEAKNYPKVDGSTATLPLAQAIYELTTGSSPEDAARNIVHNKTTESYFNLMDKSTDLIISYAPPSDLMKTIEAVNQSGKNQTYTNNRRRDYEVSPILIAPVGKDALVFLNSQKNKVKNVTEQQLQDIYSGKIKNWKELGGEDHVIKAFQRPKNSGSQNLMEKFVMKDVEMTRPPSEWVASEMGELIEKVAAYDNSADAMGYSVYYYARNMKKGDGLQFLQVNGVEPNSDTIRSGDYPYTNPFYIAIRADEPKDSPAYQIYQWVLSMNGQALVNELGYVANEKSDVKISSEDLKKIGLEEKNDTVSGKYFPDHTLLALPGSTYGDHSGIVLLNEQFQQEKVLSDLELTNPIYMPSEGLIALRKSTGENTGIYDIKEQKWVVEASEEHFLKGMENGKLVKDNFVFAKAKGEDLVGYEIYDVSGKLKKTIDLTQYGHAKWDIFGYGEKMNGFLTDFVDDKNDLVRAILFDKDGEILIDSKSFDDQMIQMAKEYELDLHAGNIMIKEWNPGTDTVVIGNDDKKIIYHVGQKKILGLVDDHLPSNEFEKGEKHYILGRDKDGTLHCFDAEGNPTPWKSSDFDQLPDGDGLVWKKKDSVLAVLNVGDNTSANLDLTEIDIDGKSIILSDLGNAVYTMQLETENGDHPKAYAFKDGKVFAKGKYCDNLASEEFGDISELDGTNVVGIDGLYTVFDADGKALGTLSNVQKEKDSLLLTAKNYYIVRHGNYAMIYDYSGNALSQMLAGQGDE